MTLKTIVEHVSKTNLLKELYERSDRKERLNIKGSGKLSKGIISSALAIKNDSPLLVIVPTLEDASRWYSVLELMGWNKTFIYPSSESRVGYLGFLGFGRTGITATPRLR